LSKVHCDCVATASWHRLAVQVSPIAQVVPVVQLARQRPVSHLRFVPQEASFRQTATPPAPQVVAPLLTQRPLTQLC